MYFFAKVKRFHVKNNVEEDRNAKCKSNGFMSCHKFDGN